jgi:hypothetical protein
MAFEVDGDELRRRVSRATGNPFIRSLELQRVEVYPGDQTWWSGREHRYAHVYLSEMDLQSVRYVQEMNPTAYRRLMRLLSELLEVPRVEFLALGATHPQANGLRTTPRRPGLAAWRTSPR